VPGDGRAVIVLHPFQTDVVAEIDRTIAGGKRRVICVAT